MSVSVAVAAEAELCSLVSFGTFINFGFTIIFHLERLVTVMLNSDFND